MNTCSLKTKPLPFLVALSKLITESLSPPVLVAITGVEAIKNSC